MYEMDPAEKEENSQEDSEGRLQKPWLFSRPGGHPVLIGARSFKREFHSEGVIDYLMCLNKLEEIHTGG